MSEWTFREKRRARAAQVELVGLVFIVIIVVTGMLIYMSYKVSEKPDDFKGSYVNKELATNLILAMSRVNVKECPDQTLSTLLTDCAGLQRIYCSGKTSCQKSEEIIEQIMKDSPPLGKDYNINIARKGSAPLISTGQQCTGNVIAAQQTLIIMPSREQLDIVLKICAGE